MNSPRKNDQTGWPIETQKARGIRQRIGAGLWLTLALPLPALTAGAVAADQSRASPPDVEYTLRWIESDAPSIEVTVKALGSADGLTTFAVAEEWGGFLSCGKDFVDVAVRGADLRPIEFEQSKEYEWIVRHEAEEPLVFSYRLRQSPDRKPPDRANDYRPMISDDLIHVIGNHGLAYPKHLSDDQPRFIRLNWRDFDRPGWSVASSFGPGTASRTVSRTLDEFRNSLFLGGRIRLHERSLRDHRIGIAIHGTKWLFQDEAFVGLVARIIEAEREFFDDWDDPWYLVSLIPAHLDDPHSLSLGGTGLTNAFALFVTPNARMERGSPGEKQMKHLLAHEYFHRWNGGRIDFPEPERGMYWFSEGFTDFYARRLLLRSGLWDEKDFLDDLNESIRNYYLSPVRDVPNARIVDEFWKNPEVQTLPYRRGDLVALVIDHQIARISNGTKSLDDLMRRLLTPERRPKTKIDVEMMIGLIGEYTDSAFAAAVRRCVEQGELITLPDDLGRPGFRLVTRTVHHYDLGFDADATQKEKKLVAVREGSAAHRAGLRDGQRLAGWSMALGDSEREVELTILDGDQRRVVRYLPQGQPIDVPAFVLSR